MNENERVITLDDGRRVMDPMTAFGVWAEREGFTDADFAEDLPRITAAWDAHLDGEEATSNLFAADESGA